MMMMPGLATRRRMPGLGFAGLCRIAVAMFGMMMALVVVTSVGVSSGKRFNVWLGCSVMPVVDQVVQASRSHDGDKAVNGDDRSGE